MFLSFKKNFYILIQINLKGFQDHFLFDRMFLKCVDISNHFFALANILYIDFPNLKNKTICICDKIL